MTRGCSAQRLLIGGHGGTGVQLGMSLTMGNSPAAARRHQLIGSSRAQLALMATTADGSGRGEEVDPNR